MIYLISAFADGRIIRLYALASDLLRCKNTFSLILAFLPQSFIYSNIFITYFYNEIYDCGEAMSTILMAIVDLVCLVGMRVGIFVNRGNKFGMVE